MVLLGHNGAGKTTLLNYLLGMYTDLSQHPFLPAFDLFLKKKGFTAEDFAYAPEVACLEPELSAKDYFRMSAAIRGVTDYEITPFLEKVSLGADENKAIKHYSKGMKQRLLLALALFSGAGTLILDEPVSGLDPFGKALVEDLIVSLAATHTILLSTHSLELASRLNEEVWILRQGEVVFDGKVEDKAALEALMEQFRPERIQ